MTGSDRENLSPPPTLETLRKDHAVQGRLCDDLEALADGLPELPAGSEVRALCGRIEQMTATHFARAEAVFGALPKAQRPSVGALATLCQMHQLDEIHAQDLVAALMQQATFPDPGQVGQLAYMLRCFFDGCRRLIALKESWIARTSLDDRVKSG